MTKLLAAAAFLLASTAAQAQYTIEYGGHTIRIDPDRGTVSIPGVFDNTGRNGVKKPKASPDSARKQPPQQAKVDPQQPAPPPAEQAPPVAAVAPPPGATANTAPAETAVQPPPAPPPPPAQQVTVAPQAPATAPASGFGSPLGVWLTEEKEGKIRIEQCGSNLCGYSVDAKSNKNGEQVLINMKPANDQTWTGRILDPGTGSTYDSTIALRGADRLRVQGCAFGGMFCGGQTWTRVN